MYIGNLSGRRPKKGKVQKIIEVVEKIRNIDIYEDRRCPLVDKVISTDECFDICMVIEDGAPRRTAPAGAFDKDNCETVCQNCPYHEAMNG